MSSVPVKQLLMCEKQAGEEAGPSHLGTQESEKVGSLELQDSWIYVEFQASQSDVVRPYQRVGGGGLKRRRRRGRRKKG